jgi:hypothetical protein
MLTPSLGITAVLAALWSVSATLGTTHALSARALDPAVAGSLTVAWGIGQLVAAVLLGLALMAPWPLVFGPGLLLIVEIGDVHSILAATIGGQGAVPHAWAKGAIAAAIGLLAIAPVFAARFRIGSGTLVAYLMLGGAALALDAKHGALHGLAPLLSSVEEWFELVMQSLLTAAYLTALHNSRVSGRLACEAT